MQTCRTNTYTSLGFVVLPLEFSLKAKINYKLEDARRRKFCRKHN